MDAANTANKSAMRENGLQVVAGPGNELITRADAIERLQKPDKRDAVCWGCHAGWNPTSLNER